MKVRRENLLVIAGVIWMIAGINILIIGISAYSGQGGQPWWVLLLMALGSLATLGLFHGMFGKLVRKHVARINGFQEPRQNPLLFFDLKSYLVMIFMITLGVTLRVSGIAPDWLIAFFYTGLGTALLIAGVGFLAHRVKGPQWRFHKNRPMKSA